MYNLPLLDKTIIKETLDLKNKTTSKHVLSYNENQSQNVSLKNHTIITFAYTILSFAKYLKHSQHSTIRKACTISSLPCT